MVGSEIQRATRRELVRGGLAVGAIAAAAWVGDAPDAQAAALRTDADILRRLLEVEQVIVYAYTQVLAVGVLSARTTDAISPFLTQEQAHVRLLAEQLRSKGGKPVPAPASVAAADDALAKLHVTKQLSSLSAEKDALELLIGAEAAVTGGYYIAIAKFAHPGLLTTAAETMADEAQHDTVLRRLLHPHTVTKYVPSAFVAGNQRLVSLS